MDDFQFVFTEIKIPVSPKGEICFGQYPSPYAFLKLRTAQTTHRIASDNDAKPTFFNSLDSNSYKRVWEVILTQLLSPPGFLMAWWVIH